MPLIAIILVLVAVLGGYFAFFRNDTPASDTAEPTPIATTTTTEVPTTTTPTETPTEPAVVTPTATSAPAKPPTTAPTKPAEVTPPVETKPVVPAPTAPVTKSLSSETIAYRTPAGNDNQVAITFTLTDNKITDVAVNHNKGAGVHNNYQKRFDSEYRSLVIGKTLDTVSLARVGGASLTSQAFNQAVATIAR